MEIEFGLAVMGFVGVTLIVSPSPLHAGALLIGFSVFLYIMYVANRRISK